ncbi:MAG TPA: HD domain-containing phosphohydrolase [Thermomicrobiales bacterium]|nr:HD domain-containing phosphohydrolase [Thermomicrobiales bacterium]
MWTTSAGIRRATTSERVEMHVLIVADDLKSRTAVAEAAAVDGVTVETAETLEAATRALTRGSFGLVIVRERLGDAAPADISSAVRATAGGVESRLVAMAASRKPARQVLSAAGFDDVLDLPVNPDQVRSQVVRAGRSLRQRETLRKRDEQLEILNTLAYYLSRSNSVERQVQHALQAVSQLYPYGRAAIWLRNDDGCVSLGRSIGLSHTYQAAAEPVYGRMTAVQWSALGSRPRFITNPEAVGDELRDLAASEGFAASLDIALIATSGVMGTLVLYFDEPAAPADDEVTLLETIAATTAMAIVTGRLAGEMRQPGDADETYSEIFEHLPDPVFMHDADGHFVLSNPAMLALSGYPESQLEQHTIYELFSGDDADLIGDQVSYLLHLARGDEPTFSVIGPLPVDLMRADRQPVHADLYLRSLRLPHLGNDVYIQGIVRDVSENERVRQELNANQTIVRIMAEAPDLDTAMIQVWDIMTLQLGYTRGGIWTVSPDGSELVTRAAAEGFSLSTLSIKRGIIGRVARERKAVFIRDVRDDPDYISIDPAVVSEICVPILRDDRIIGVIDVEADETQPLEERDLSFLRSLATQLAGLIERAELHDNLERQASTDLVTGLPNRQVFQERLDNAVAAARHGKVSMLMIGVDNFKGINELYGHISADDVLRQIARALDARISDSQVLARYTSDTFTVLLPGINRDQAVTIAENLRIGVAMQLFMAAEQVEQVTVSIGAATYPDDATSAGELLQAADHAMYLAKRAGRNQTFQSNKAFATLAPHHGRITDLLRQSPKETLSMLVRAMDQRLPERKGHSERVTRYTMAIARQLNMPDTELPRLRLAAYIHDIGMATLPDSLLRKPGRLSPEEREQLRNVPLEARDLLAQLDISDSTRQAVVHQRENWDGTGHPDQLRGQQIPLGARIIAVADAIDAMTSARAHREPMTIEEALEQVNLQAGTQFDPDVAAAAQVLTSIIKPPAPAAEPQPTDDDEADELAETLEPVTSSDE